MLTLITWNIQCARTLDDGADLDRVVDRVLAFGAHFDILLLQEVGCGLPARDGRPIGDQFAGLARRLDHLRAASAFALDACNPDGSPRRLGCMTFAPLPHPAAAVLAGDFNMVPGSDGHARLLAAGLDCGPLWRDAWELAHPGEPHAPTVRLHDTTAGPPCTFDYACVSPALAPRVRTVRVDTAATGSGHQPLLLELA
jgi:endonuclease/exonuclease/phosphatase family metal-dependent hydrolase